jgi:RNA-directed DNA polymerase
VEEFERHLEANLEKLAQSLREGTYRPQAIRRAWIPKLGSKEMRPLGIPTVRDRVVQAALRAVLEPIFERDFAAPSYGFRPRRSCKDALRRVDTLLKQGCHLGGGRGPEKLHRHHPTLHPHAPSEGEGGRR